MTGAPTPSPAAIRATVQMAGAAISTARHKACGLSLSQHELLLKQVADLYAAAVWIEEHRTDGAIALRLWAGATIKRSDARDPLAADVEAPCHPK